MVEVTVTLLVFVAVMCVGGAVLAARKARRAPLDSRLRQLEDERDRDGEPIAKRDPLMLRMTGRLGKLVSSGDPSKGLKMELTKAGYTGVHAAATYLGAKVLFLMIGLVILLLLLARVDMPVLSKSFLIVAGSAGLSFAPNLFIAAMQKRRQTEVRQHLPDMLDLIEICVSAGMGMDMAWNSVTDEVRQVSPILSDEMALTNLEIHLGSARGDAMRHMADRTDNEELSSMVAILVQSERFGTSVADALRTFAESVRHERSQRAEEHAEKMAVKLLVPMILFIFPTILIVVVGPAGMRLAKMLLGG